MKFVQKRSTNIFGFERIDNVANAAGVRVRASRRLVLAVADVKALEAAPAEHVLEARQNKREKYVLLVK